MKNTTLRQKQKLSQQSSELKKKQNTKPLKLTQDEMKMNVRTNASKNITEEMYFTK